MIRAGRDGRGFEEDGIGGYASEEDRRLLKDDGAIGEEGMDVIWKEGNFV